MIRTARRLGLALAVAAVIAAFGTLAHTLLPADPPLAERAAVVAVAPSYSLGTLAQRNAYVGCVAPATEVTPHLRVRLLTFAGKALEGIRAGVPAPTITAGLARLYGITRPEASRVYWCTLRVWGR